MCNGRLCDTSANNDIRAVNQRHFAQKSGGNKVVSMSRYRYSWRRNRNDAGRRMVQQQSICCRRSSRFCCHIEMKHVLGRQQSTAYGAQMNRTVAGFKIEWNSTQQQVRLLVLCKHAVGVEINVISLTFAPKSINVAAIVPQNVSAVFVEITNLMSHVAIR